jgi:glycosyltransferase involved in cell wall biosynthesis
MLLWTVIGAGLALAWCVRAIEAIAGMRRIADISSHEWDTVPERAPLISVVVPARNEQAEIERCLRSLIAQDYPYLEIIAVDDRSDDGTGAIMDRLAADSQRLRVIHVRELPERWLGKTHAMWLAASQARGDWLLFTDGDIVFDRQTVRRSLAYAQRSGAGHFVLYPSIELHTIGERMMIGFFAAMFVVSNRPWKIADRKRREHIGIGAFNMITRRAYESLGTYEALRLNVIDDLSLGKRAKEYGIPQRLAIGPGLITLRWAKGTFGVVQNLEKNFFALLRFRVGLAIAATLLTLFLNIAPFVGLFAAHGWARWLFGAACVGILGIYVQVSRLLRVSPLYFFLHPISTLLVAFTMFNSVWHAVTNRGIVWRGTKYSLRELREHLE